MNNRNDCWPVELWNYCRLVKIMIDRISRLELAQLINRLIEGKITNDQFVGQVCKIKRKCEIMDIAVSEIAEYGFSLIHDLYPYYLKEKLKEETITTVARCILFLKNEMEYRWPRYPRSFLYFIIFLLGVFFNFICIIFGTLKYFVYSYIFFGNGLILFLIAYIIVAKKGKREEIWFWGMGEKEFWPFFSRKEYEQAIRNKRNEGAETEVS